MKRQQRKPAADSRWMIVALLAGVLLIAAFFRLQGFRWDAACGPGDTVEASCQETHLHPDERFLTMVATAIELPETFSQYLDSAASPANPANRGFDFFSYGVFPVLLTRALAEPLGLEGYDRVHLVGRAVSALCSLLTVLMVVLLGRRLYGWAVGLVAGLLLAVAVLPIQQAHFFTVDAMATTLSTAALLAAVGIAERGRWRDFVYFGLALGAAVAVKISVVTLAMLAIAAAASRAWSRHPGRQVANAPSRPPREPLLAGLVVAAAVSLAVFRLLQPYAFAGPGLFSVQLDPRWLETLRQVGDLVGGWSDFPPGHQWTDRTAYWFPWRNMLLVGLGPALGLAAWIGWGRAGWRLSRGADPRTLVPWLWVAVLFAHQGGQWVTSMRYLLPIYPPLALFAAAALVAAWRWAWQREPLWPRVAAAGAATLVLIGTLGWAWAFTSIYRRPHSRVEASRWLYANVSEGAAIAHETWDDALPLPLDGKPGLSLYQGLPMSPYDEDSPTKLDQMIDVLDRADYLVLSSNRLYDSIPRLPMRYPMTVRYYHALFSGELGFERVADFTSYPGLLGWELPDQGVEEAFSVYDHPRVQIFARTSQWSPARARSLLDHGDWDSILRLTPRDAASYDDLMLPAELREEQERGGTWSTAEAGLFPPTRSPWVSLLLWVLGLEAVGLCAFVLFWSTLRALPDRGWLLAKTLGLLLLGFAVWFSASLQTLPFTPGSVRALALLLTAAAAIAGWYRRQTLTEFLRERWRLLLAEELLFWCAFALMLWIRWLNPDLWHPYRGGEKPMDLAYLNAVVRSTFFPPYDPWFAGGTLNYYYFGFVLTGTLTLLTRVSTEVAYNLAIPTFFALTAAGACSAMSSLVRRHRSAAGALVWGTVASAALLLVGNLGALKLWLQSVASRSLLNTELAIADHHWYWNPSRAIPHPQGEPPPITEFPLFTFLFADLHAHLMSLSVTVLVLALLAALIIDRRSSAGVLGLLALGTGSLAAINTWDLPTYIAVTALGLLIAELGGSPNRSTVWRGCLRFALRLAMVVIGGRLLFLPFHRNFVPGYGRLVPWQGSHTPVSSFLVIHALFLVPILAWLWQARGGLERARFAVSVAASAWRSRRQLRRWARSIRRRWRHHPDAWDRAIEGWGLVVASALLLLGHPLEAMLVALGAAGVGLLLSPTAEPSGRLVASFVIVGAALALAVEYLVIAGDVGRMNTVFKVYLQVWTLWAMAATFALASMNQMLRRRWTIGWIAILIGALLYPVMAIPARIRDRFESSVSRGLDGGAFMATSTYPDEHGPVELRWDDEAIRWLKENAVGSPVVLEASVPGYRWGSRISVHTGMPTVLGWDWHQRQQRAIVRNDPVGQRQRDITAIYTADEVRDVEPLLERYRVRYLVLGRIERLYYPGPGLEKFELGDPFREVYRNPEVTIYEIHHEGGTD